MTIEKENLRLGKVQGIVMICLILQSIGTLFPLLIFNYTFREAAVKVCGQFFLCAIFYCIFLIYNAVNKKDKPQA